MDGRRSVFPPEVCGMTEKQSNYKKIIVNILTSVAFFNLVFLMLFFMFSGNITGNLLLQSKIIPGETFESEFTIDDLKEVTLIFETSKAIWDNYPLYEVVNITVLDPKGDVVFYQLKAISLSKTDQERRDGQVSLIKSSTDTSSSFVPETTGKYHIEMSNVDFPSSLSINSGMINPTKKPFFFIGSFLIWFAVLLVISINFQRNNEICSPSMRELIIALPISLIITALSIYVSSL